MTFIQVNFHLQTRQWGKFDGNDLQYIADCVSTLMSHPRWCLFSIWGEIIKRVSYQIGEAKPGDINQGIGPEYYPST